MCSLINEKIVVRDIFANSPIENKDMYSKALEDIMIDLGVVGVSITPNVRYPIFYLKDYLYSKLYSKISAIRSLDHMSINHLEFNILEINIIGRPDE